MFEQEVVAEATESVLATAVHGSRDLAADVLTALGSLLLLALLQNLDVIILGSKSHGQHSGAYAAISVPAKALVFVGLVLVNYLLPEATIRHQAGSHALKQLAQTFAVLAIPCLVLLGMAVVAAHGVLGLVFGHHLTEASHAFSTLVLAMIFMSVTVVLAIYLLGIGWRWVVLVLAVGAGALAIATSRGPWCVHRHRPSGSRRAGGIDRRHDGVFRGCPSKQCQASGASRRCFVGADRVCSVTPGLTRWWWSWGGSLQWSMWSRPSPSRRYGARRAKGGEA